jgi:hypothetical protein
MKRAWTLTMSALAAAALASCGGGDDEPAATADPPAPAEAAPANAAPAAVDLSTADIETWHSYYYLDPTPDRLGEYMLHLASRNHFRDFDNAYSTGAFVAKVLEANPELAEAVAERLREVPFRQRWGFNYGLWLSGIAGANDLLSNEAQLVENPVERDPPTCSARAARSSGRRRWGSGRRTSGPRRSASSGTRSRRGCCRSRRGA